MILTCHDRLINFRVQSAERQTIVGDLRPEEVKIV